MFEETIRYNLLLGNDQYSDNELLSVCEKVGLLDLIMKLPNGLDTKIGVKGNGLSGGQKQRLMIARILLKKADIIIFDEATSALDDSTENIILEELEKLGRDITLIIISHRHSTIKNCDRIIVIHEGCVDGIGKHEELLESSNIFRDLFLQKEVTI